MQKYFISHRKNYPHVLAVFQFLILLQTKNSKENGLYPSAPVIFLYFTFLTKEPLDQSERGEWKSWLKTQHSENKDHGIWSHHFLANRWGNNDNRETLFWGGSKITADGDCSHEIKRRWLLGRKAMTNLDSMLKRKDTAFPTKHLVEVMAFLVVMYGCEG